MTRHSLAARATTARSEVAVADIEPNRDRDQEAHAAREQDRPVAAVEGHADRVADHLRVAPPRAAALRALKAERLLLKVAARRAICGRARSRSRRRPSRSCQRRSPSPFADSAAFSGWRPGRCSPRPGHLRPPRYLRGLRERSVAALSVVSWILVDIRDISSSRARKQATTLLFNGVVSTGHER